MMMDDFLTLRASDILGLRPRYGGALLHQGLNWSAEDRAALATVCAAAADLDQISPIFGRRPETLAHKASDMRLPLPRQWSRLIRKSYVPRGPRVVLEYPYMTATNPDDDDRAMILAVNAVVPRGLPGELRNDVCQDLVLAILEGEVAPDQIAAAVPLYLKAARKRYSMPWGTVSIDAPIWDDGRPLSDIISENPLYQ